MKKIFLLTILLLFAAVIVPAQSLSQSSLPRYVSALPSPNICVSNDMKQALLFVRGTGIFECIGNTYVRQPNGGGASNLDALSDVAAASPANGQFLRFNGSQWVNSTLTKSDLGLSNVDNTSDANKPISTAQATAINAKIGTITAGDNVSVSRIGDNVMISAAGGSTESLSANYGNSLANAISTIGTSAVKVVPITIDTTVSAPISIPANITLRAVNGAKIIKASTGSINCLGNCLEDAKSSNAVFSGFAIGEITFSGTNYPRVLSSDLWAASSLSEKLNRAIASINNKPVEILATPGTLTTKIDVTAQKTIRFSAGTYGNDVPDYPQFKMFDNTALVGAGQGLTILKESSVPGNVRMIYGSGLFNGTLDGKNYNINVSDLTITGDSNQALDSAAGTIFLGNVTGFSISRVTVSGTHGFGAYVGAFGTAGNYAERGQISDCIFEHLGTQYAGVISGKNIIISRNIFIADGLPDPSQNIVSVAVIDLEPNHSNDRIENVDVVDNIIDLRKAQVYSVGIIAQSSDAPMMTGLKIARNKIVGGEFFSVLPNPFIKNLTVGIAVSGAIYGTIENNWTFGGAQTGVEIDNSYGMVVRNNEIYQHGGGGIPALGVYACANSKILDNIVEATTSPTNQAADIKEIEKTQTVTVTSGNANISSTGALVYDWWKGRKIVWNGTEYTVLTTPTNRTYTVSPTPSVSGIFTATTKFSSNIYKHNFTSGITLTTNSGSVIYSLTADSAPPDNGGGTGDDTDAVAYYTAAGITDAGQRAVINTYVTSLKSSGVWTKLKAAYLFVTGSQSKAKFNLKNPVDTDAGYRLTIPAEWTFSSSGATANSKGADTHLIPASALTVNSVNLSFWANTNGTADSFDFRAAQAGNPALSHQVIGYFQSSKILADAYNGAGDRILVTVTGANGFNSDNVTTSTGHKFFQNAVQIGSTTSPSGDLTQINQSYIFGGQDVTSGGTGRQYRYAGISAGLTDAEETAYYNATNTCVNASAWNN